ncbi:hypothetical protein BFP76_03460 [Amylibacter kogurei]|uniref:SPOR domain-containing protein n=1 Tax=Paramylibacter kogurei TaxID=1889778 RepID=A0A2G5K437_9RHOB|nr:SPOR domain-containing protein [Amylibacter kogurei]PIB24291.1 hypothetical protein BFP76_03460 [Amylibacter kogurei]
MSRILQTAAAVASLGTVCAVVYWGVTLSQLDPNTVPVIRKAAGPARIAPEDPGGLKADHQGLAVNAVQAQGSVEIPTERVVLAPRTGVLLDEDLSGAMLVAARATNDAPISAAFETGAQTISVPHAQANVDDSQIDLEIPEVSATPTPTAAEPVKELAKVVEPLPADLIRPKSRPRGLVQLASLEKGITPKPVTTKIGEPLDSVPLGSKLVQLGAFDSIKGARSIWAKTLTKHSDLLGSKDYIIQKADSGGRVFYRLRVAGFDGADDARALCTALKSRKTPCIAVTAR